MIYNAKREGMMQKSFVIVYLTILALFMFTTEKVLAVVNVVTTNEDLASITKYIGKDKVAVESLAKGYENIHFVRPRPSFIVKLSKANMLVVQGLEYDNWVIPLVEKSSNKSIFRGSKGYVNASTGVKVINQVPERIDRSWGDVHPAGNPHYQLDPVNGKFMAKNITEGLKRVDPQNALYYENNYQQFLKTLAGKLTGWFKAMEPLKGKKIITYHASWPYFAQRFGLTIANTVEPKPGIPPSTKHIKELIEQINVDNIQCIMVEPYFNRSVPDMISQKTGIPVIIVPSSTGGVDGAADYFTLFDKLVALLNNKK